MTSHQKTKTDWPNLWLEHIACNQQMNGQLRSGTTSNIPPLFDGSTSWFKYEELIDDWLDLTVLEAGKRGPALKNRFVGDAEMYKGLPIENL